MAFARVAEVMTRERTQWVVEADIKGFFDHVGHSHMVRFLEHRIADPNFLRLIQRFLKAGVMEDGAFRASDEGTPQGGLVSPVLSNIYLHYVLDLWFEKRFAKSCQGKAFLVRFADDCVPRRRTAGRMPCVQPCCTRDEGRPLAARRTGGGCKPPTAAALKRRGRERVGKRPGETRSGKDRGVERK